MKKKEKTPEDFMIKIFGRKFWSKLATDVKVNLVNTNWPIIRNIEEKPKFQEGAPIYGYEPI